MVFMKKKYRYLIDRDVGTIFRILVKDASSVERWDVESSSWTTKGVSAWTLAWDCHSLDEDTALRRTKFTK